MSASVSWKRLFNMSSFPTLQIPALRINSMAKIAIQKQINSVPRECVSSISTSKEISKIEPRLKWDKLFIESAELNDNSC